MRKIADVFKHIGVLAFCTLVFTACPDINPEPLDVPGDELVEVDPVDVVDPMTRHAYIVNPGDEASFGWSAATRTDFDGFVGKFKWSAGDSIAVHLSNGTYDKVAIAPATSTFISSTTASNVRDAYAVYPAYARDAANYGDPTLKVVLPAEYDITGATASDYSPVPMIAVNSGPEEDDLLFRHVGGLLRITCNRVPVGTQYLAVTFDRNVAGSFTVANPASENPTISTGGNTATVTFKIAENGLAQRTDGIVLNIPVPTGTFSSLSLAALDASKTALQSSAVDHEVTYRRGHGRKMIFNVTPAYTDSMQMVITTSEENGKTFRLPFLFFNDNRAFPADLLIDWGDGASTFIAEGTLFDIEAKDYSLWEHAYSDFRDYTITLVTTSSSLEGRRIPMFTFSNSESNHCAMLKDLPTPILYCGYNGSSMFRFCSSLLTICPDLFSKNPRMNSFSYTFNGCSSLQAIPEGLFDYTTTVYSFMGTFYNCSGLTGSIPADLFTKNEGVEYFTYTFYGCKNLTGSIPENLFATNPDVKTFEHVFRGCSGLTGSIPVRLFEKNKSVQSFYMSFYGCKNLTGTIPADLFANCLAVTDFRLTFAECSGLSGISPGLFAKHDQVDTFGQVFRGCSGLTCAIPEDLFEGCELATDFSSVFESCRHLRGPIPANLFAGCKNAKTFEKTFDGCTDIDGSIPGSLFAACKDVTTFARTFAGCSFSGQIPGDLFSSNTSVTSFVETFSSDTQLTSVSEGLFAKNLNATDFQQTFWKCFRLSLNPNIFTNESNTPATRFNSVESMVRFNFCFYGCGSYLTSAGDAPALWSFVFPNGVSSFRCFTDASTLDNKDLIPNEWK